MRPIHLVSIFITISLLAGPLKAQRHIDKAISAKTDTFELFLDLDLGINGKNEVSLNYYLPGKDYSVEGLRAKCSMEEPRTCFIEDNKAGQYFLFFVSTEQRLLKLVHYRQNPLDLPIGEIRQDLAKAKNTPIQIVDYIGLDR